MDKLKRDSLAFHREELEGKIALVRERGRLTHLLIGVQDQLSTITYQEISEAANTVLRIEGIIAGVIESPAFEITPHRAQLELIARSVENYSNSQVFSNNPLVVQSLSRMLQSLGEALQWTDSGNPIYATEPWDDEKIPSYGSYATQPESYEQLMDQFDAVLDQFIESLEVDVSEEDLQILFQDYLTLLNKGEDLILVNNFSGKLMILRQAVEKYQMENPALKVLNQLHASIRKLIS